MKLNHPALVISLNGDEEHKRKAGLVFINLSQLSSLSRPGIKLERNWN